MNNIQECACRAIDEYRKDTSRKPLLVLAPRTDVSDVRNMISISMTHETESSGSVWRIPDGRIISVHQYGDAPPKIEGGFELAVCNGGIPLTEEECRFLKRWRDAAG